MWISIKTTNHYVIYFTLFTTLITHINRAALQRCNVASDCANLQGDISPNDQIDCFLHICTATCNHPQTNGEQTANPSGTVCGSIDPSFVCKSLSDFAVLGTSMHVCLPTNSETQNGCPMDPTACKCTAASVDEDCDSLKRSPLGWIALGIGGNKIVCDDAKGQCTSQCTESTDDPLDYGSNPCPLFGMKCVGSLCEDIPDTDCSLLKLDACSCANNNNDLCALLQTAWQQLYQWGEQFANLEIKCNVASSHCGMACVVPQATKADPCNAVDYKCSDQTGAQGFCVPSTPTAGTFGGTVPNSQLDASDTSQVSQLSNGFDVGQAAGLNAQLVPYSSNDEPYLKLDIKAQICNVLNSGYTMEVGIGYLVKEAMYDTITTLTTSEGGEPVCESVDDIHVSDVSIEGLENLSDLLGDWMNTEHPDNGYTCPDLEGLCDVEPLPFELSVTVGLSCGVTQDLQRLVHDLRTAIESGEFWVEFTEILESKSSELDAQCLQGLNEVILEDGVKVTFCDENGGEETMTFYTELGSASRISHFMGIMIAFAVVSFV